MSRAGVEVVQVHMWQSGGEAICYADPAQVKADSGSMYGYPLIDLAPGILKGIEGALLEVSVRVIKLGKPKTCWKFDGDRKNGPFGRCTRKATARGGWWRCTRHREDKA